MDYQQNIVNIFNVDWINQWYLSKNESSCHSIYFKVIRPNKYFRMKFCKRSNCFVIIFITDSVSSSSDCSRCLYSTDNVFYRDRAAITTLWSVECFLWSMEGAWIGHLHHLVPHQLCSPNWPTTTNCTRKRCKTMVQFCQYQLELEFWRH